MSQKDYILRVFEDIGRALAQIVYKRQIKDYTAAYALLDEQFKQTLGMGRGFLHSVSDEMLLSLLTTFDSLNVDKCWLVATLFKVEGELFADQHDEQASYYSYLKALKLFLEALSQQKSQKAVEPVEEIEDLLSKLAAYEIPPQSGLLLFWYFEATGRYVLAEDTLWDMLEAEVDEGLEVAEILVELRTRSEAFYRRLLRKSDDELVKGGLPRAEVRDGLERVLDFYT